MNTHDKYELPPLFLPGAIGKYTKKEMQDYARAAIELYRQGGNAKHQYEKAIEGSEELDPIERLRFFCSIAMRAQDWLDVEPLFEDLVADRQRIAELEAARIAYASEFAPDEDGEPDVGRIHENIRLLKADCQRRGEPVAYIRASDLDRLKKPHIAGCAASLSKTAGDGFVGIYKAPQPAEPTPTQKRHARLRADPVKAAALDRAHERIAVELSSSDGPVRPKEEYKPEYKYCEDGKVVWTNAADAPVVKSAEPVKVPRDEEIIDTIVSYGKACAGLSTATERQMRLHEIRALLARYGEQDAAPVAAQPSVPEPAGEAQDAGPMHPSGTTMALFSASIVPAGTKLYAAQPHLYDGDTLAAAYMAGQDAARVPYGWKPIETAPKDGTPLLLFARASCATASIDMFGWYSEGRGWIAQSICGQDIVDIVPSHWMPRPPFPVG